MNAWNTLAITTLALLFTVQQCAAYKCYICSWSPASPNRTDICTRENFNKDAVKAFDGCPHGCEVVAAYDVNDKLVNFYRNCVIKGKKVNNDCVVETNAAIKKEVCRCNSNLCNEAPATRPAPLAALAAALLTVGLTARR